jgi:hypothetical protein
MRGPKPSLGESARGGRTTSGVWLTSGTAATVVSGTKPAQHHWTQEHCAGSGLGVVECESSSQSSDNAVPSWLQQQPDSHAWLPEEPWKLVHCGPQQLAQLSAGGGTAEAANKRTSEI